jgi:phage gp45-like
MFQPRPRKAGIGARKKANFTAASIPRKTATASGQVSGEATGASTGASGATASGPKGQDDFRKMLLEGKK